MNDNDEPLLSEFDGTFLGRLLNRKKSVTGSILLLLLGCGVVLLLGHLGGGNALLLRVPFEINLSTASGAVPSESLEAELVFGYVAQLNHGFFYLFLAPIGLWLTWRFIEKTGRAFWLIAESPRVAGDQKHDALMVIRRWNQRCFRWPSRKWPLIPLVIVVIMVGQNLFREARYFRTEERETSNKIGFTQAIDLPDFVECYNRGSKESQATDSPADPKAEKETPEEKKKRENEEGKYRLEVISGKDELTRQLRGAIHGKILAEREELDGRVLEARFADGSLRRLSPALSGSEAVASGQFGVDLRTALNKGLLSLPGTASSAGAPTSGAQHVFFYAFVVAAHLFEGLFHSICVLLFLKICFFLYVMHRAFGGRACRGDAPSPLRLRPHFRDKNFRYGLGEFYPVYNTISWIILIGAVAGLFMYISNASNGTFIVISSDSVDDVDQVAVAALGQTLILLLTSLMLLTLIVGPMVFFKRHLRDDTESELKECNRTLKKLEEQLAACNEVAERMEIRQQIEHEEEGKALVEAQFAWPRHSPSFQKCLWIAGILLLLPLGLAPIIGGLGLENGKQAAGWGSLLEKEVHRITRVIYRERLEPTKEQ